MANNSKLKIIITIDCDFADYFPFDNKIKFNDTACYTEILATLSLVKELNVPACFLPHTSIYIRRCHNNIFFTKLDYRKLWKSIFNQGYDIGLHPHEESPAGKYYYYSIPKYMNEIIKYHKEELQSFGVIPTAVRFGYFCLTEWSIPILEKYNILLSFDNMGGYIGCVSNHFEDAPLNEYYYSYENKEKPGNSKILAIPLGMIENKRLWQGLVPEANSIEEQKQLIDELYLRAQNREQGLTVNLLMHSYNTTKNYKKHKKIIEYIKTKAQFVNCEDILSTHKNF